MIFTTKNKELAILRKALSETRGTLIEFFEAFERGGIKGQDGIKDTFFSKGKKSPLTPELLSNFEYFKKQFNRSSLSAEALAEQMENVDQRIIDYAKTCKNGEMTTKGFKASIDTMSLSAKAGKIALQAFAALGNMLAFVTISNGIELIVKGFDNWIHRVEKANDAMSSAVDEYQSAKSSLESVNSELNEQNQKIDTLLAKDKLTYAEQGELEHLQAITKELLLQQDIEEKRADNASKEAADKAVDAYKKQYGTHDKTEEDLLNMLSSDIFPVPEDSDDVLGMIAAYTRAKELLDQSQKEFDAAVKNGEDTTWLADNIQFNIDTVDDYRQALDDNISDLQEKRLAIEDEYNKAITKRESGVEPLTSSEKEIIETYETINDLMRMFYEYTDSNTWKSMQIENIFNTKGIEKTKEELLEIVKAGTFDENTLQSYPKLSEALRQNKVSASELRNELEALAETESGGNGKDNDFDITAYKDSIDTVRSTVSTLRSALDAFNQGTLDESTVLDLMQQFPALIPYIDLAADGFGNLSEGLGALIAQQPDSLIQNLTRLKASLPTDEERAQADALIHSLQALGSYGDTGAQAYAAAVGSTWTDTANVIENVTAQFENLAKVQEAVADGFTMSSAAAAELAKMYPEILTNAEISSDGQVTLNEAVVQSVLDGDRSVIDAQIAKLEADKAELTAKKSYAEAQLQMLQQVGEGEGQITKEVAQYRLETADKLLHALIEAGLEEDRAYAAVAANMAGNMDEYNRIVGEVAIDTAANMAQAAVSMANSISDNSINAQNSFHNIQKKVWDLADAIKAGADGVRGGAGATYGGGGYTPSEGITVQRHSGDFSTTAADYTPNEISLTDFKTQLEIDIKGYTDAISNIDAQIDILKNLQTTFEQNGGAGGHGYTDQLKALENEKNALGHALDDTAGSAAEAKDEYTELFDFFERRIKTLDAALSLLKSNLDNVTGADAKNSLLDAQTGITEEKIKNYSDAVTMYTQKAEEALSKLPADIAAKIQNGSTELSTFIGDGNKKVTEAIRDYETWADKVSDCSQELAKLQTELRQLELEKFNNIAEESRRQFDLRETGKNLISKQIDLFKEAGQPIGESFYTAQAEQTRKQLALLEEEQKKLTEQMASAISSGNVRKGTDEWLAMTEALTDVEGNILDCKKAIEGFDNELQQLHWDIFERIHGQFKNLDGELTHLEALFDDANVTDGDAGWSKEGLAQLGLLAQQYELAQHQVRQYGDAIAELKSAYLAGNYSAAEYAAKLSELSAAQWDAVNTSESVKEAVIKLNETRINEEIDAIEKETDAYRKLTDAQTEVLKTSKDLHDYQQTIAEKTKNVTDLEKQLAAMAGDTSASATAKKKQLEEQLAAAKKELEDTEYSHSIEMQEQALQLQQDEYENEKTAEIETLRASLTEKEALLAQSFATIKQNAALIGQEIAATAALHGITVSGEIIRPWQNGEAAVAGYGVTLSENTSAFIGSLLGLEGEVWRLQTQADTTAASLSWMFSASADHLVNELAASCYGEQNLDTMTQALHGSLINLLEGGYDISGITNALGGISNGLNGVASAAHTAANAISSVGAAQTQAANQATRASANSSELMQAIRDANSRIQPVISTYQDIVTSTKKPSGGTKGGGTKGNGGGGGKQMVMQAYAKGGIVRKDAKNPLTPIAKAIGEDTLVAAKDGEGILTEKQTAAFQKLAGRFGTNADGLIPIPADFTLSRLSDTAIRSVDTSLSALMGARQLPGQPEIISTAANRGGDIHVHYDSLIAVNGDVNDTRHFLNDIKTVANDAIKKSWHDFEMTRKYGSY